MFSSLSSRAAAAFMSVLATGAELAMPPIPMQSPSMGFEPYRRSRTRTKGKPGRPGAKLARKAREGTIGRNYIR